MQRRATIELGIEHTGLRIQTWLAEHQTTPASLGELAALEDLFASRQEQLKDLILLDESFIDHLRAVRDQVLVGPERVLKTRRGQAGSPKRQRKRSP